MSSPLVAAVVQMNSRADLRANLATAGRLVRKAVERGARLVVLPENFAFLAADEEAKLEHAERIGEGPSGASGPILATMADLARGTKAWLVLGGMPEKGPDARHVYNTCVVVDAEGHVAARYRKIHLFDVQTADGVAYRESTSVVPGTETVVVKTPWGGLGLSVCYDVRFPELYRRLATDGARFVVVPAAFTLQTGKDHWHVLLRARAIENQVYVLAAAQQGFHSEKRATYGHSLIADPWGTVLADAPDGEGVVLAELDTERQDRVRASLPCLDHRRL